MAGFPEWGDRQPDRTVTFDAATAYVVVDAHRLDNVKPYLFKTADFGKTWTRLDANWPRTSTCTPCARIRRGAGSCTWAQSVAWSIRVTMVGRGSRCS